jgi:hypothetical protein
MEKKDGKMALIFGLISIPVIVAMVPINLWPDIGPYVSLIGFLIPGIAFFYGRRGIIQDDSKRMAIAGLILGVTCFMINFVLRFYVGALFALLT